MFEYLSILIGFFPLEKKFCMEIPKSYKNFVVVTFAKTFFCSFSVPPEITQPPVMSDPIKGSDFTMTCKAVGKPKPTYAWVKVSTLLICSVDKISLCYFDCMKG